MEQLEETKGGDEEMFWILIYLLLRVSFIIQMVLLPMHPQADPISKLCECYALLGVV